MRNQFGQAGKTTREGGRKKRNQAKLAAVIIIIATIFVVAIIYKSLLATFGGVGVLILFAIIWIVVPKIADRAIDPKLNEEKKYNRGAKAEEKIGELLAQLGSDYVVMNDWRSPYGNIDHIVHDNRGNIFMIETKSHGGRVQPQGDTLLLNGHEIIEKNIIQQSLSNSFWMKEKIEQSVGMTAWITPVIVFTNAFVEFGKPIKGVYYLNKKFLLQFIREHKGSSPAGLKLWEMRRTGY